MLSRATMTIAVVVTALVSCGAANLHTGTSRVPIAVDNIVAAMRAKGVLVQPAQISFLATVTASETAPRLHIAGSRKFGNAETAVRFACDTNTICLPFFVILRGLDDGQELLLSQAAGGKQKPPARAEKPCMRNGEHASLVIEGRNMRITLPVIALQNGRVGETIRVTDTERKKVYRAEVSGPGLLKGSL